MGTYAVEHLTIEESRNCIPAAGALSAGLESWTRRCSLALAVLNAVLSRQGCSWGGLDEVCALIIPQAATSLSREDSSAWTLAARAPSQSLARAIALAQVLAQTPKTVRA